MKRERPVILPKKVQLMTLIWILNPQQRWLSDSWQGPCMVTLLSISGVQIPVLTVVPLGKRTIVVTTGPLGAPRIGERKRGGAKTHREEGTRWTGIVTACSMSCIFPKDTAPIAKPSKKTLMEAFETSTYKPHIEKYALIFSWIIVQMTLIHNQVWRITNDWIQKNTFKPCKQVKRERPIILQKKSNRWHWSESWTHNKLDRAPHGRDRS